MLAPALALGPLSTANRWLWTVVICAYALLLFKLWYSRLYRSYPFFSGYLAYRLARSLALIYLPFNKNIYGWVWVYSAPLAWLLYILVVLELYSLVLRNYRGIASLGRWTLTGALVVSILISALTLWADLSNPSQPYPILLYCNVIERGVISSLVIFLLLITAFLVWYPVPLNRNVIVHSIVYSVYFLSITMALLVRNVTGHEVISAVNLVLTAVTVSCLLIWIMFLNRKGESQTVVLRRHWRPETEDQLVEQLAAINSTLLRAARKQ